MTLNETVANQYARKKDNGRDGHYLLERNNRLAELKAAEIAVAMGSADNSFDKITDVKIPEYMDALKRKITDEKVYARAAIALAKLNEELKEGPREQLRKLEALAEENIAKTNTAAKEYKKADDAVTGWYVNANFAIHGRLTEYKKFGTPEQIQRKIAELPELRTKAEKYFSDKLEEEPIKTPEVEKEPPGFINAYTDAKNALQGHDYSSIDKSIESASNSLENFKSRIEAAAKAMKNAGADAKIVDETLKEISTLLYESKDSPQEKLRILKERIQEKFKDLQTNNAKKIDENDKSITSSRETFGQNLSEIAPYEKFGTVEALNRRLDTHTVYSGLCKLIENTKATVEELNTYRSLGKYENLKTELEQWRKVGDVRDVKRRLTIEDRLIGKPVRGVKWAVNKAGDLGEGIKNKIAEILHNYQERRKQKQEVAKILKENNIELKRDWFERLEDYKVRAQETVEKRKAKDAPANPESSKGEAK